MSIPFRASNDARRWFQHIRPGLDLDFDVYYMCVMAGLATGKAKDLPASEADELVDYFPGEYAKRGRLLVMLLLSILLERHGVSLSQRATVHQTIRDFIDPLSQSKLSDTGVREMNKFAFAGFDVIAEWFSEPPHVAAAFLPRYAEKLQEAVLGNPSWRIAS
jgi:hypothetical protein